MSPVQAVRTTGIYCRPDCSARPHRRNVEQYVLPAAAEAAGYRACLQCRPWREERPPGAVGPELVCRAVQLVLDGGLDGCGEESLGARLGVSPRHLRRQFVEHLGVTPDQLARSRRAHFARRLLDDTDLPVGEVALAAGYGSVRQLNRACHDIFGWGPRDLRARRRRTDRLVADGGLDLRLPYCGELDWPRIAVWLSRRAIPGVESVDMSDPATPVYRRTIEVQGSPGVIELRAPEHHGRSSRDATGAHLVLRAHLPHWEGLIHLVRRARRIAALDWDVTSAGAALAADSLLGPTLGSRPGLRPGGTWDPFETGVRAIVGQQVSVAAATTVAGKIVARTGRSVGGLAAFGLGHLFPSSETLAEADLEGLGLPAARRQAVRNWAIAVAEGQVPLDRSVTLDELVARVTAVRGLGPWTANYLALRMGETDAFPASDLGLRRGVAALGDGTVPDVAELAEMSQRWRPWRALAAIHLWSAVGGAGSPATVRARG